MTSGGEYIHGTDPSEQKRLSLLNDLLNDGSLRAMGLRSGDVVLDVGSGLGQLTRRMAEAVAGGHVVGIERDPAQLAEATRLAGADASVEFRQGEASTLPLRADEWGTFDVVHARFLVEHVPDPQAVVNAMYRAARPGGRIVLEDDDHDVLRLWPEPPGIYELWRAYIDAFRKIGNDPYIGRRLVELLNKAGAGKTRNSYNFFGCCAGQDIFAGFVENFAGVINGARKTLIAHTNVRGDDIDTALTTLREWGKLPDAALWYCTFWAEGHKIA